MSADPTSLSLPDDLRRFILTSIASVPHLEALLLLRAVPDKDWNSQAVAQRLYVAEGVAFKLLEELCAIGALNATKADGEASYRYGPRRSELTEMIDRVAAAYAANLVAVSGLIHSKLDKKAQQFADAFTWRKDV